MPPHHHWCKTCGSGSFEVLSVKDTVKMKCNGCGKISYKSGRYAFRLARSRGLMERRAAGPRLNLYPLTGLLACSVCGKRIYHKGHYWWCKSRHVKISNDEAMQIIPDAISVALQDVTVTARESIAYDPAPVLADLERQRLKIQAAYESEIYTHDEAERKIKAINAQVKRVKDSELAYIRKQQERETFEQTLEKAKAILAHLPEWIRGEEAAIVNALLLRLCRSIVVTPEHGISVEFRG